MGFQRTVLWAAVGGLVALAVVAVAIEDALLRAFLAILSVTPLLYFSVRVALRSERQVAHERRKYIKLRSATEEFLVNVRNLNRLKVVGQMENAPADLDGMIEEVIGRMHRLVDRMREAAGHAEGGEAAHAAPPPEREAGPASGTV